jgi:hypothetical protein
MITKANDHCIVLMRGCNTAGSTTASLVQLAKLLKIRRGVDITLRITHFTFARPIN